MFTSSGTLLMREMSLMWSRLENHKYQRSMSFLNASIKKMGMFAVCFGLLRWLKRNKSYLRPPLNGWMSQVLSSRSRIWSVIGTWSEGVDVSFVGLCLRAPWTKSTLPDPVFAPRSLLADNSGRILLALTLVIFSNFMRYQSCVLWTTVIYLKPSYWRGFKVSP